MKKETRIVLTSLACLAAWASTEFILTRPEFINIRGSKWLYMMIVLFVICIGLLFGYAIELFNGTTKGAKDAKSIFDRD